MDPLNYFLVILGGFGVVWGYRCATNQKDRKIGEFEYAAFSAIWGIPVFLLFVEVSKAQPKLLENIFTVPMIGTPALFLIGLFFGLAAGEIRNKFLFAWEKFKVEANKDISPN